MFYMYFHFKNLRRRCSSPLPHFTFRETEAQNSETRLQWKWLIGEVFPGHWVGSWKDGIRESSQPRGCNSRSSPWAMGGSIPFGELRGGAEHIRQVRSQLPSVSGWQPLCGDLHSGSGSRQSPQAETRCWQLEVWQFALKWPRRGRERAQASVTVEVVTFLPQGHAAIILNWVKNPSAWLLK